MKVLANLQAYLNEFTFRYRLGKKKGDDRFVDGKTGRHVRDPYSFCCNFFDW